MSSPSEGDFKEFILSDKLSDLENYNADNVFIYRKNLGVFLFVDFHSNR